MGLIPLSLDELSLIPTACVYNPKFVNLRTSAIIMIHAIAINTVVGTGIPGMNPPFFLIVFATSAGLNVANV